MNVILENCFVIGQKYTLMTIPHKNHSAYERLKNSVGESFIYKGSTSYGSYSTFEDLSGNSYELLNVLFLNSDRFYYEPNSKKANCTALILLKDYSAQNFNDRNKRILLKAGTIFASFEKAGRDTYLVSANNGVKYTIYSSKAAEIIDIERESNSQVTKSTETVNIPNVSKTSTAVLSTDEDIEILTVTKYIVNGMEFDNEEQAIGAKKVFKALKQTS